MRNVIKWAFGIVLGLAVLAIVLTLAHENARLTFDPYARLISALVR
jgi:hypothetical protein